MLRTGHTYSGHPAGCVAALTNIAILRDEGLFARAPAIGAQLEPALLALLDDGLVTEVRGTGGIWAVDLPASVDAVAVRDAMIERGVIARPIGATTIALCPPLVTTETQLDQVLDALRTSIRDGRRPTVGRREPAAISRRRAPRPPTRRADRGPRPPPRW